MKNLLCNYALPHREEELLAYNRELAELNDMVSNPDEYQDAGESANGYNSTGGISGFSEGLDKSSSGKITTNGDISVSGSFGGNPFGGRNLEGHSNGVAESYARTLAAAYGGENENASQNGNGSGGRSSGNTDPHNVPDNKVTDFIDNMITGGKRIIQDGNSITNRNKDTANISGPGFTIGKSKDGKQSISVGGYKGIYDSKPDHKNDTSGEYYKNKEKKEHKGKGGMGYFNFHY